MLTFKHRRGGSKANISAYCAPRSNTLNVEDRGAYGGILGGCGGTGGGNGGDDGG